jgi:DNA-binding MarR family transcriptional regulator
LGTDTPYPDAVQTLRLGRIGDFVGFRLRRIQNQLSRNLALATAEQNLRSGLFSSLAIIEANPGLSQNELSREVGLDKSVTVQIVDELEKRGLAKRVRSKVDRRRYALRVTPRGAEYLDQLFKTLTATESAVLNALTPEEIVLLNGLLDRMYLACREPITAS